MIRKTLFLTALLLTAAARAGDLTVNNLTVAKDATVYGRLNLCSAPANSAVFTNGLAGCWLFNGNVCDFSGNNNHGAIVGNVILTADRFGTAGNACQFSGKGYVRVPSSASLCIRSDVSVSVWIKPANQCGGTSAGIIQKGWRLDRNYELAIGSGEKALWEDVTRGRENWSIKSGRVISDGAWHHLVGTWDGQTVKLYVDGICQATGRCSSSRVPNNDPLYIGYGGFPFGYFTGAIDDLQIYSRSLSANEVLFLYNCSTSSNSVAGVISALKISVSNGIFQTEESGTNIFMGKVGIGADNPVERLHVSGNVRVDGTNIVSAMVLGGVMRTDWPGVVTGALMSANNLSDLADKPSARANLGLGTAATRDASSFDNAGAAAAVGSALTAHSANQGNPHQVTAVQVGALTPAGDGSHLTGITAAQVGALSSTGGVVNGSLSVSSDLFVNGTNVADLMGSGGLNVISNNLDMATNRIVNLGPPVEEDDALSLRYLWVSLSNVPPMGDLSMGVYTNR